MGVHIVARTEYLCRMRDYHRLEVWREGHDITLDVYRITRGFPDVERFEIAAQLRRAAASVPTNIAEGCGRRTDKELAYFVRIATGSAMEAQYLAELAASLGYVSEADGGLAERFATLARRLRSFERSLDPRAPRA